MTMSGGDNPRGMVTTTPAISTILDDILKEEERENTVVTRATTYDNAANLPAKYLKKLLRRYEGTSLGRQELFGERLMEIRGARWNRAIINKWRRDSVPCSLSRVVVAVDPSSMTYAAARDEIEDVDRDEERAGNRALCGIVVAGLGEDGHAYVLADLSRSSTPAEWASVAVSAVAEFNADRIVYEANHGGKRVEDVFYGVDSHAPLKSVMARQGKHARAEPVVALYERGLVHHVGGATRPKSRGDRTLVYLEDQMCSWTPQSRRSPDRMDALVYALTELMLGGPEIVLL
jgi:phage terminase large subunit-like protein